MKRIAIPIANDLLSTYFGECNYYEIVEIDGENIKRSRCEIPAGLDMSELPEWLHEQKVTDLIAHKVNKGIITLFATKKVNLFLGIPLNNPDILIQDYLNGKLESDNDIINEITNFDKLNT